MDIMQYITQEALILIPVLWIIGAILKATPNMPDWTIPYALLAIGIVGAVLLMGSTPQAYIQGILVAGAAVLGHQLIKQAKEGD